MDDARMRTVLLLAMITVSEATLGALIATQLSVFSFAMTLAPIANVVGLLDRRAGLLVPLRPGLPG